MDRVNALKQLTEIVDADDVTRLQTRIAALERALEDMGALYFRADLSQKDREERSGEIARRIHGAGVEWRKS